MLKEQQAELKAGPTTRFAMAFRLTWSIRPDADGQVLTRVIHEGEALIDTDTTAAKNLIPT